MSNFSLLFPAGAPFKQIFPASIMLAIDQRWPKISNWIDGSDHTLSASATVALRGDGTNLFRLALPVEIDTSITVAADATLTANGTSGHPALVVFGQYSTSTWQSGAAATWASGATATFAAGSTFTVFTTENVESGGKIRIKSGAILQVDVGGSIVAAGTAALQQVYSPTFGDAYAASYAIDFSKSNNFFMNTFLTGNLTLSIGGWAQGGLYTVRLEQDPGGGHTVTWPIAAFPNNVFFGTISSAMDATGSKTTAWLFLGTEIGLLALARNVY